MNSNYNIAPGIRITARGEDFLVIEVKPYGDKKLIVAEGISELVMGNTFHFLSNLDTFHIIDPKETKLIYDSTQGYRKTKLFVETQVKNAHVTSKNIEVAHKTAINRLNYQLVPTLKALNLPRPRLLIADAVGLGKTIEVGIFLTEMIKRGRGKRILVIALKSILSQFQQEIWNRFAIPLVRLDSQGILKLKATLPSNKNPFDYYNKSIISIDTLKNNARFLNYIEKSYWDIIVIDECHIVSNTNSLRGELAELLSSKCESLILASATPHNGKRESFTNLMRMLEPTSIPKNNEFTAQEIEPFYVRRLKNDIRDEVQEEFMERKVLELPSVLYPEEESFLKFQQQMKANVLRNKQKNKKHTYTDVLFTVQLFKSYLSSPEACLETIKNRLSKLHELSRDNITLDKMREELETARALVEKVILNRKDSKFEALVNEIKNIWEKDKSKRLLIFSERIETQKALLNKLTRTFSHLNESNVELFHGGLSDIEQQSMVEKFGKEDSDVKVMIASDAGAAGVNLHYYCHHLFNYDIPWSIITLDQRNGRIDRYKQRQTPYIYYLIARSDIPGLKTDLHIIEKLKTKEEEVYNSIGKEGDPAAVFRLYDTKREEREVTKAIISSDENFLEKDRILIEEEDDDSFDLDSLFNEDDESKEVYGLEKTPYELGIDPIAKDVSFYDNDELFYSDLINQLIAERAIRKEDFQIQHNIMSVVATKEINQLLFQLPPEARKRRGDSYLLSLDKNLVNKSIDEARKKDGEWARYQMLYDLNPIAQILMNKLQATIPKGTAFVAPTDNVPKDSAWFVFHGQYANGLGQPVVSVFYVVGLTMMGTPHPECPQPILFSDFVSTYGIDRKLYTQECNDTQLESLSILLDAAIRYGKEFYLKDIRGKKLISMQNNIEMYQNKLEEWFTQSKAFIELKFDSSSEQSVRLNIKNKRVKEITTIKDKQSGYYKDMESLDNEPFIRVLSVFFNS